MLPQTALATKPLCRNRRIAEHAADVKALIVEDVIFFTVIMAEEMLRTLDHAKGMPVVVDAAFQEEAAAQFAVAPVPARIAAVLDIVIADFAANLVFPFFVLLFIRRFRRRRKVREQRRVRNHALVLQVLVELAAQGQRFPITRTADVLRAVDPSLGVHAQAAHGLQGQVRHFIPCEMTARHIAAACRQLDQADIDEVLHILTGPLGNTRRRR